MTQIFKLYFLIGVLLVSLAIGSSFWPTSPLIFPGIVFALTGLFGALANTPRPKKAIETPDTAAESARLAAAIAALRG